MNMDNNPGRESIDKQPMAKFERCLPGKLEFWWKEIIGNEKNIVKEKTTKDGNKPPVIKIIQINDVGIIDQEEGSIIHGHEDGVFKRLAVNKDYFVGAEEDLASHKRALVLMNYKIDDEGKMKQTIRKYYKGE